VPPPASPTIVPSEVRAACRALAASARFGALATVARDPAGWPFATLVAVAFDERGRPLLLLSRLAEHTKNLEACARASLLVTEAPAEGGEGSGADPLARGRMTLVGECARLTGAGEDGADRVAAARARFVHAHPSAAGYASFADFAVWRLEVAHVRWVGGFGKMEWLAGDEYADDARR
jgi:heme oxygenase (biliverdin-IX-beta and delta-forming)